MICIYTYHYSQVEKLHQRYILLGLCVEKQKEGNYNGTYNAKQKHPWYKKCETKKNSS